MICSGTGRGNGNLVFVAIAYGISNLVVELFFTLKLFKYGHFKKNYLVNLREFGLEKLFGR